MKTLLLIEDEESLRASLKKMLTFEDYNVIVAEDGPSGVAHARQHLPDLILCDIMLPGLDGFGVAEALHGDPITATIPLIFLTAKAEKEAIQRGMELGVSAYVTKPFTLNEILDVINAHLP
ncbi:MAG TPA: response regulator [Aggregatilinea sp.]|jgi:CheY-like chemotaxis protein|uniref:response regulator transcription factor n=1 Tax=Aggregatilinea sp. TaxID=2806333 RepID=UPI002CCFB9CE|nr:response regulator [Aggregatilinea sp.]HML22554.1 response regulator [Aggregatilinea sp.]